MPLQWETPKFLHTYYVFRIPGSGHLGEVSIGSAKRSTFGKAPLVTALPYDIIGPVARKSPSPNPPPSRTLLLRSLSFFHHQLPLSLFLDARFPLLFLLPRICIASISFSVSFYSPPPPWQALFPRVSFSRLSLVHSLHRDIPPCLFSPFPRPPPTSIRLSHSALIPYFFSRSLSSLCLVHVHPPPPPYISLRQTTEQHSR